MKSISLIRLRKLLDEVHLLDTLAEIALVEFGSVDCLIEVLELGECEQGREESEAHGLLGQLLLHQLPRLTDHLIVVGVELRNLVDVHPFYAMLQTQPPVRPGHGPLCRKHPPGA